MINYFKRYMCVLCALIFLLSAIPGTVSAETDDDGEDYIKWVDFTASYSALEKALELDIAAHDTDTPLDWVEMLAWLAAKYGGDFSLYKSKDLDELAGELSAGTGMETLTEDMVHYDYYREAYEAVLGGFVGEYSVQIPDPGITETAESSENLVWETRYGLKVFSPIAGGFPFEHYDDFGSSRDYGYDRRHLGHDMFGAVGTPIIAVESGTVQVMGWNQYGGWRIGIRSFDGKRYYYYAHLRQNRPYHVDLEEGQEVKAGDVIGYMGRTGYSPNENVNNIRETHLHLGLQLIFHPSQEEGAKEIWVDLYPITRLLQKNRSETYRVAETKEFYRMYDFRELMLTE